MPGIRPTACRVCVGPRRWRLQSCPRRFHCALASGVLAFSALVGYRATDERLSGADLAWPPRVTGVYERTNDAIIGATQCFRNYPVWFATEGQSVQDESSRSLR